MRDDRVTDPSLGVKPFWLGLGQDGLRRNTFTYSLHSETSNSEYASPIPQPQR